MQGGGKYLFPYFSWHQNFFLADFHQNDIRSDLADAFPGNDVFLIRTEKSEQTEWTGNDDGPDTAVFFVEHQIIDPAKPAAVAAVDDVFFLQFTKVHGQMPLFVFSVCGGMKFIREASALSLTSRRTLLYTERKKEEGFRDEMSILRKR